MALRPQQVAPELLNKVTKALGITALDQWYYVSHHAITQAIGDRVLHNYGDTVDFLKSAYPHHQFDEEKLISRKRLEKDQRFIEVIIRQLFPDTEIQTKARKAVGVKNPETNHYLEIDFWIPSLNLGIEYQDKHHYEYQWYANGALEDYQRRDNIKKVTMPTLGYTLVTIGYWWDKTPESIAATIRKFRPDLLRQYENSTVEPISSDPPASSTSTMPVIPGVAGIMSPFIPSYKFDPTGWYAGEKHDGIRGVFNPELGKMFSRFGKELSVLPSLLQDIPDMLLDGEIVAGRGNYSKTAAVSCHTHHDKVNWPAYRYVLFDIPDAKWGDYKQRYSAIISGLATHPFVFAQATTRALVVNNAQLKVLVDAVIGDSGEGVIVQKNSLYEYGRAKSLAKMKIRRDAEARVLRVNKLSCVCKLVSGATTNIVFCASFDASDVKVGDIVSYYHTGFSQNHKPKKAEIYKIRYDVTWEKLISDDVQDTVRRRSVKESIGSNSFTRKRARNKHGHWNKASNVRAFLDKFASANGFDPLVPENWSLYRGGTLRSAGSGGLLNAFGNNLKEVLSFAYPESKFESKHFKIRERTKFGRGHWSNLQNVRAFLDEFARTSGFDPLVAENWYSISGLRIRNAGASGLLNAYGFKLQEALAEAYPELKFEAKKFRTVYVRAKNKIVRGHWNKLPNVRAFLDQFASAAGFDPLVPENWYTVKPTTLKNAEGSGLLRAYGYSLKKALSSAYPELAFNETKFRGYGRVIEKNNMGHWNKSQSARVFFDEFARKAGLDPLQPESWYPISGRSLQNAGGSGLLKAYGSNLMNALSTAYPELIFEPEKFRTHKTRTSNRIARFHWSRAQNVRAFFDRFAGKAGFDPLVVDNWHSVKPKILRNAGGMGLLKAYGFNLEKALSFAYPELKFEKRFGTSSNTSGTKKMGHGHWKKSPNVRAFLDRFASAAKFDPLALDNWYSVSRGRLRNAGGSGLLNAFNYDLKQALSSAYPELNFIKEKFITHDNTTAVRNKIEHRNQATNVRAFFESPLPENLRDSTLQNSGEGSGGLRAYSFGLKEALSHAYHESTFEGEKFRTHGKT